MATPKRPPLVLLLLAALLVVGIGAALWRYSRFNTVHAVNGLPATVDVTLEGQTYKIPSGQRVYFSNVPVGTHVIVTTLAGKELETALVFVKGGGHDLVYNVGGAAPLVWERIAYSKYGSNQEPQWNMFCGRRFVDIDSVDYAFVDPPSSISTKGGGTIYKTHLTVDMGGLSACESWALDKGTQEMWADWHRLEARIDPKKVFAAVEEYARQGDLREAQALLEAELSREPSFITRALYESVLLSSGQAEKARARFQRTADDASASDEDLYLAARLLRRDEKLAFIDQALLRFPQSGMLLYQRAHVLDRRGDTAQAVSAYELADARAPRGFEWSLAYGHIAALLRLKRYREAWDAGQPAFKDSTSTEGAVTYANLAMVTGNSMAGWDAKLKPFGRSWAGARLGLDLDVSSGAKKEADPESFKRARELIRAALQPGTPAALTAALAQAGRSSDSVLRLVPDDVVWLLLTEAWRVGNTAAAARLLKHSAGYDAPRVDAALTFIATGQLEPQLELASDAQLSVLWLARGRRLATLGQDAKAAYDEARRLDAFHAVVWRALDSWPAPQVGEKLAWLPVDPKAPKAEEADSEP